LKILNGRVRYTDSTLTNGSRLLLDGVLARFECSRRFNLVGSSELICKIDENGGEWPDEAPVCKESK